MGADFFCVSLKCFQPLPLEEDHVKDPYGDGSVSEIENRREEADAEHVDHPAMEPASVMENLAIEQAVDDVAHGTCRDERQTEQHTEFGAFFGNAENDDEQGNDCHDAEDAQ